MSLNFSLVTQQGKIVRAQDRGLHCPQEEEDEEEEEEEA